MIDINRKPRLTMIRGTDQYDLNDFTTLFTTPHGPVQLFYLEDSGLGLAPLTRFAERGPAQHGDTDLGFRYDPRVISYIFGVLTPLIDTPAYLNQARRVLLRMFHPGEIGATMRYTFSDGEQVQADGHLQEGLAFGSTERIEGTWFMRFAATFKMNDPSFYDPVATSVTTEWLAWQANGGMQVPLVVPMFVGPTAFDATIGILYDGTFDAYPTVRINGPIRNPLIEHLSLGISLPLTGYLGVGEYWDIVLTTGKKDIVDAAGVSQISRLADPNNIDVFRLVPAPDIVDGYNYIKMTGSGANGATSMVVTYNTRFAGI
jgi:hypothetical protein